MIQHGTLYRGDSLVVGDRIRLWSKVVPITKLGPWYESKCVISGSNRARTVYTDYLDMTVFEDDSIEVIEKAGEKEVAA